jgi:hypothetical protein
MHLFLFCLMKKEYKKIIFSNFKILRKKSKENDYSKKILKYLKLLF